MASNVLTDFSPAALARANRENQIAVFQHMGNGTQTAVWQREKVTAIKTMIPIATFNLTISSRLARIDENETIAEVVQFFKSHQTKAFTWLVDPTADGSGWDTHLTQAGLRRDASTPGMAMMLDKLPNPQTLPKEQHIEVVENDEALRIWTNTMVTGFGMLPAWEEDMLQLARAIGIDLPVRYYTGYLNGSPVAASMMYLAAGMAGIYNVVTLPEARRRGLGTAVTLAPLYDARELGYRAATLQASNQGFGVYQRLGFQTVCQMEQFIWEE